MAHWRTVGAWKCVSQMVNTLFEDRGGSHTVCDFESPGYSSGCLGSFDNKESFVAHLRSVEGRNCLVTILLCESREGI